MKTAAIVTLSLILLALGGAAAFWGHIRSEHTLCFAHFRSRSTSGSKVWGALALVAVLSPFLWLAAWPHDHPLTSWIGVAVLVLVGLLAVRGGTTPGS